jgi:creatinine amidohydrolase
MELALLTWPKVEEYLKTNKTIIIPIGSTEQHGPTGIIGTDYITAQKLAIEVGKRTNTMVSPPLCFGMAYHHMDFPGTMTLKPSTMMLVLLDMIESCYTHGFKKFMFINGHGGNINPTATAFCEWKIKDTDTELQLENWWRLPEVQAYEKIHFGDENGFHATCGEVALTMYLEREAFKTIPTTQFKVDRPKYSMPMAPKEFRKMFSDGRMASNPGLATAEHGAKIYEIAVDTLAKKIREM